MVKREGIRRLWPPHQVKEKPTMTQSAVSFDHTESVWSLFDACLWVVSEGIELTFEEIAERGLDDLGAEKLFKALNEYSDLLATGINRKLLREVIPATYWELATLDPVVKGHIVDFIDGEVEGFWGTLTPSGDDHPRWTRITVDVRALKRIFPFKKAKPSSCRTWLEHEMLDSPDQRPKTKAQYLEEAVKRFSVSKTGFKLAWRTALENVPEAKPFWSKAGRPKNQLK